MAHTHSKETRYWPAATVAVAALAALLSLMVRDTFANSIIPLLFIAVIVVCARYFGALAGILSSLLATLLFSLNLLESGKHMRPPHAEANLGLMLFAGVALSYAVSTRNKEGISSQGSPLRRR